MKDPFEEESTRSRRLRDTVGGGLMDFSGGVFKPTLRRLLGLPGQEPNPHIMRTEQPEDDSLPYSRLVSVPEDEHKEALRLWHEEGRRGAIASESSRYLHRLGYKITYGSLSSLSSPLTWPWRKRVFWREFDKAEKITWKAHHYARAGESTQIDGELVLPSGRSMSFDIQAAGDSSHWVAEEYRTTGGADVKTGDSFCPGALVAADALTPALLVVALRGWYVQHYAWRRGHWAILERRLPEFVIDASWEGLTDYPEGSYYTPAQLKRYEKAARDAELRVQALLGDKHAAENYELYGADPVPPELLASLAASKPVAKTRKATPAKASSARKTPDKAAPTSSKRAARKAKPAAPPKAPAKRKSA